MTVHHIVGASVPRKEGWDKVTGAARYVDDMVLPGMLYGATVRSSIARGKIGKISFDPSIAWGEFVLVTARDIPGKNCVALILEDQHCLASDTVNHAEEPILLLAHADRHKLRKAVEAVSIENNGVIAAFDPQQGITVWGSLQCPYYVHKALMALCGLPEDKIRVVQMETGGAFGGKEEYPSMIAGHAALLSIKSGRPVKIVYDRMEDMVATTKRHPSRTRHRTAVNKDGKILGGEIEFTIDGGAYATLSSVVLSRGTIHAGGPYYWPNVRIRTKAVATNTPPHGAFRGFGAPQSLFAMERHMDRIAQVVGISPAEIRQRNFLKRGQTTTTQQVIREEIDLNHLLDRALELSDYAAKKTRFAKENKEGMLKKGIGIAAFLHGAGFTGSGERYLNSLVGVEAGADGNVRVLVSSAEFGQGTNTVLCQIAAEALGLPYESAAIAQPDTTVVPNSGPTVASRTAMIVGKLVQSAAKGIRQTLTKAGFLGDDYTPEQFRAACQEHIAAHGALKSYARYEAPGEVYWDDEKYRRSEER